MTIHTSGTQWIFLGMRVSSTDRRVGILSDWYNGAKLLAHQISVGKNRRLGLSPGEICLYAYRSEHLLGNASCNSIAGVSLLVTRYPSGQDSFVEASRGRNINGKGATTRANIGAKQRTVARATRLKTGMQPRLAAGVLTRVDVITECFNPNCHRQLRYLRGGRVVRVVRKAAGVTEIEHFWLCKEL